MMTNPIEAEVDVAELGAASDMTLGYAGGPFESWLMPDMQDHP